MIELADRGNWCGMINLGALMSLLSSKDKDKFEELYHLYERMLFAHSMSILKNTALAEEAVSETFLIFANNFKKIYKMETTKLRSYVMTINRNVSYNIYNKEKRENSNFIYKQYFEPPELSYRQDNLIDVRQTLDSLPVLYRDILLLKYSYGFETAEIAKMTSQTVNQINYILTKSKKMINRDRAE